MSFFDGTWTFGSNDFDNISFYDTGFDNVDIENEIEKKDLFQDYDDGEIVASKSNAIKMDKYIQELSKVGLFGTPSPKHLVHSSLTNFLNIIQLYNKEQQDVCRDIRRKGRNKIHALKCRQKQKDELEELQAKVRKAQEERKKLFENNAALQKDFQGWKQKYDELEERMSNNNNIQPSSW